MVKKLAASVFIRFAFAILTGFPIHPYYYVLAAGDLDGDGIDELVVRRMEFEVEEDHLELWAWEYGGPVTIHEIP